MRQRVVHGLATALGDVAGPIASHRERCLRCQADDARMSTLGRELASIGSESVPAPEWLVDAVMADLDRTARSRRAVAFVSAAVAALAAIAAAALAVITRRRMRAA